MAEVTQIIYTHKEIAEMLVKKQDIHEGIWGITVKFGYGAANINGPDGLQPAAIVPLLGIGIQKFDAENELTVDAARVNPLSTKKASDDRSAAKKKSAARKTEGD